MTFIYTTIVGGGLGVYYATKQCVLRVKNSYFSKNLADIGSCVDSSNREGFVYVENCTFFDNIAMKSSKIMGAGSVFKLSGAYANVISISSRILNNYALSRGEFLYLLCSIFCIYIEKITINPCH